MSFSFTEVKVNNRYGRDYFVLTWNDLPKSTGWPEVPFPSPPIVLLPCSILKAQALSWTLTPDQTYFRIPIQGSMDGATWTNLKDTAGVEIELSDGNLASLAMDKVFRYLRPAIETDASGATVTVEFVVFP